MGPTPSHDLAALGHPPESQGNRFLSLFRRHSATGSVLPAHAHSPAQRAFMDTRVVKWPTRNALNGALCGRQRRSRTGWLCLALPHREARRPCLPGPGCRGGGRGAWHCAVPENRCPSGCRRPGGQGRERAHTAPLFPRQEAPGCTSASPEKRTALSEGLLIPNRFITALHFNGTSPLTSALSPTSGRFPGGAAAQ